jgi:hypothetical protein
MKVTGRIVEVFSRPWEGRNGPITLYSFKLQNDKQFYRTGENELAKQGDFVEFEADAKGNVSSLSVSAVPLAATPPAQPAYKPQGVAGGGGYKQKAAEKDAYWADKEARDVDKEKHYREVVEPRITWASAQSDAVRVVNAALQHDLLAFGNANKSAKLGLLLEYVDQVTARFAAQRYNAPALLKNAISAEDNSKEAASDGPDLG